MSEHFHNIHRGTYYPDKQKKSDFNKSSKNEFIGDYWKVWFEEGKYFLEHDIGHFASKFVTIEIQKEAYEGLRNGSIQYNDFIRSTETKKKRPNQSAQVNPCKDRRKGNWHYDLEP